MEQIPHDISCKACSISSLMLEFETAFRESAIPSFINQISTLGLYVYVCINARKCEVSRNAPASIGSSNKAITLGEILSVSIYLNCSK